MGEYGWSFYAVTPENSERPVYPAAAGSLSYDSGRDVSKTISGIVFLPDEIAKFDTVADQVRVVLTLDGVAYPMGYYSAVEATRQKNVLLDPSTNEVADLWTTGFGDRLARLIRSDGKAQTLQAGFDPAQAAIDILADLELPFGWEGSASPGGDSITWDGSTTVLSKIVQLSELAGHRHPWMNNDGVIRSVVAQTPPSTDPAIVDVSDLLVEAASLTVTETFLGAPNVVIVTGNSGAGDAPVTGRWDAPSVAPHSFANRGYFYTQMVSKQGLRDSAHATQVAEAIGESNAARQLSFRCQPTSILDGPVTLRYDNTLWVVSSWSIDLSANGTMDVTAQELTADPIEIGPLGLPLPSFAETFTLDVVPLNLLADDGTSSLTADVTAIATALSVTTTGGTLWSTTDPPYDILVGSEVMRVTAVVGTSSPQTFTVTRSINGVLASHPAGSQVSVHNAPVLG